MRKGPWLALGALLLAACGSEEPSGRTAPANRKPNYFDVKSFLDGQVADLNRRQPAVEKQVRLRNGKVETTRVMKTDWGKELQIFYQADINKPALRGAYKVEQQGQPDAARIVYQANGTAKAPVTRLAVATAAAQPQTVTATIKQDNALFYSEKKLLLLVRNGRIAEYQVDGLQKLVLFDTVRYSVRTRVLE